MHLTTTLLLFLFSSITLLSGQVTVKGTISDTAGEPLGFATIHIKNTTRGTTANASGEFVLSVNPGQYDLVFHYLGYEQKTVSVLVHSGMEPVAVILQEQTYAIPMLEIRADAEDPAYAIIRKTIEKRRFYKDYLKSYKCDVYIKGVMMLDQIPERMLESMIESMDGWIDSTGKGILYLSESESIYYFEQPDKSREEMISSRVSGDSRGFSFNRFGFINFYENSIDINRPLVNPIGNNALNHYRYRLDKSYYDEENRQINKIQVIPRTQTGPLFSGYIYILEGKWLIHSLDLYLTGEAIKLEIADQIRIQQKYIPATPDYYSLFNQQIEFTAGIFGFKFKGMFNAITSNYELNYPFEKGFFSRELVRIESGANEKDETYWDAARPIPLTVEEQKDYQFKDSIAAVQESKPYLDSLDKISNKFKIRDLYRGYSWRNRYEGLSWRVKWNTNLFNAVQGWTAGISGNRLWTPRDLSGRRIELGARYMYGFSDNQHRYQVSYEQRFNGINQFFIEARAGYELRDLNPVNSVPNTFNAWLMLIHKNSINRFYNSRFLEFSTGREVGIGHFLRLNVSYDSRSEAFNTSDFSFSSLNEPYAPNNDLGRSTEQINLGDHQMLNAELVFTLRPGIKYISYPNRRFYSRSSYPVFQWSYKAGTTFQNALDHQLIRMSIYKNDWISTIFGSMSFHIDGGYFLQSPTYFHDYKHFTGGPILVLSPTNYLRGFKLLPLYGHSTRDAYFQGQVEWNDNSFLFDRIPGINQLGFSLVYGASQLYTPATGNYTELSVGIDRIGYSFMRLFRVDIVWALEDGRYQQFGFRLGLKANL